MKAGEMRSVLRAAGRTKAERAAYLRHEAAKRGEHWVLGGPETWSKDEVDNEILRLASAARVVGVDVHAAACIDEEGDLICVCGIGDSFDDAVLYPEAS